MKHTIAITFDAASLSHYTDSFLATLWHVSQANPAPIDDKEAGEIAEQIGREIIRRFLAATPPDLWAHQGTHHYWRALTEHCRFVDGKWVPNPVEASVQPVQGWVNRDKEVEAEKALIRSQSAPIAPYGQSQQDASLTQPPTSLPCATPQGDQAIAPEIRGSSLAAPSQESTPEATQSVPEHSRDLDTTDDLLPCHSPSQKG